MMVFVSLGLLIQQFERFEQDLQEIIHGRIHGHAHHALDLALDIQDLVKQMQVMFDFFFRIYLFCVV